MIKEQNSPVLQVRNLSVDFNTAKQVVHAVKSISFDLFKAETLAIVGESGSGKSVSAMSIMKLLPYPYASHPSGEIIYQGKDLLTLPDKELRRIRGDDIAMIFQEPLTALNPLHTIEKQINEVLILHQSMSKSQAQKRVLELLDQVGIKEPQQRLEHYPHQLSGGQRQRVMIAMSLANEPEVLIADEPTTALDVTIQRQILDLIGDLQNQHGLSVILISHDLNIVKHVSDRVAVMKEGEIVEQGNTNDIYENPGHSYTQKLINAEPFGAPSAVAEGAMEILNGQDIKVWFPIKKGVFKRTVDHIKAVNDVNLKLREAETIGIVGESGSGKTTLAFALLRLYKPEGKVVFLDKNISSVKGTDLRDLRQEMQIVFQDPFGSLSPRMSVQQIIEEGLVAHELCPDEDERENMVISALTEVGLDPEARHRYPHEFSGGQRQRICIARALILKPKLIVLDEPTSALDRTVQSQVIDLLRELQQKYKIAYIFISHDLKVVRAVSHKILVLRNGEVVEQGTSDEIFNHPRQAYTQTLLSAAYDLKLPEAV